MIFRWQGEGDYLKFEMDSQRSFRKLLLYEGGQEQTLAATTDGYEPGAVMRLLVEAAGDEVEISLDGTPVFGGAVAIGGAPSSGTVGLYCWGSEACWFDEVVVR